MSTQLRYRRYIDRAWTDSDGDGPVAIRNPAAKDVLGVVPQATASDLTRAIAAARRAFDEGPWAGRSLADRAKVLLKMAEAMEPRLPEIVELNIAEAGSI